MTSDSKGLLILLQHRAVLVMWSEKFSLSSITIPRFLAVFEGVMVDEPNWKVRSRSRFKVSLFVT